MKLTAIHRYPVKGLSPELLTEVTLAAGGVLPQDRRFAIAHGATRFDSNTPQWLPKTNFLMLARNERLAKLKTHFDEATGVLTIERDGKQVCRANLQEPVGRRMLDQFIAAFLGAETHGAPRLVEAPGHVFSDNSGRVVSLINLASVRDLERVVRAPVDPLRFRGNLHFEGTEAWQEFNWIDRVLAIGPVRLKVQRRIRRCAATNVDPVTAAREMADLLAGVTILPPSVPVVANVTARPHEGPDTIRGRLVEQITGTVRWQESVAWMSGAGVTRFIEIGAGKVLSGLVKRISPDAETATVGTPEEVAAVAPTLV